MLPRFSWYNSAMLIGISWSYIKCMREMEICNTKQFHLAHFGRILPLSASNLERHFRQGLVSASVAVVPVWFCNDECGREPLRDTYQNNYKVGDE
jgi:hypothetical protein